MPIASGANSVASALGNRPRRDPGAAVRTYHEGAQATPKTGTFYLAGKRNFLLGSDMPGGREDEWLPIGADASLRSIIILIRNCPSTKSVVAGEREAGSV